jgi:hypothetical protein
MNTSPCLSQMPWLPFVWRWDPETGVLYNSLLCSLFDSLHIRQSSAFRAFPLIFKTLSTSSMINNNSWSTVVSSPSLSSKDYNVWFNYYYYYLPKIRDFLIIWLIFSESERVSTIVLQKVSHHNLWPLSIAPDKFRVESRSNTFLISSWRLSNKAAL